MDINELLKTAQEHLKAGNLEEAVHAYNRVIAADMNNREANERLAELYLLLAEKENMKAHAFRRLALTCYRRVIELTPSDMQAHERLIKTAGRLGILDDLLSEYKKKLENEKNAELSAVYGKCIR